MKQFRSLLWKEWREDHIYLWIGLGVLLILPLINAWQEIYYLGHFELHASAWIFLLGGIFAIVVSVGISCRDLAEPLENFWHSRPIGIGRWMLAKYAMGAVIVLLSCVGPAIVELLIDPPKKGAAAAIFIVWFPFLWIAIFTMGFFVGALLRKTAQTSLIAISAMMLLYILPIILPPLRRLSVWVILDLPARPESWESQTKTGASKLHPWSWLWGTPQALFACGMLALTVIFIALALFAVKRDWHLAAGRRTMFGSIVVAFLLLLLTTAFQLGTNMPILQTLTLPNDNYVYSMGDNQGQAMICSKRWASGNPDFKPGSGDSESIWHYEYRRVSISPDGKLAVSEPVAQIRPDNAPVSPINSDIYYEPTEIWDDRSQVCSKIALRITDIASGTKKVIPVRDPATDAKGAKISWQGIAHVFGHCLYSPGDQLVTLDISKPLSPKIVSITPYRMLRGTVYGSGAGVLEYSFPSVPGLSAKERFLLAGPPGLGFEDGLLLQLIYSPSNEMALELYKLESLTETRARFVRIAERKPTLLESVFHNYSYDDIDFKGGRIYMVHHSYSALNATITVLTATGPHPLQLLGHFGLPRIEGFYPLDDGRCIVGGGSNPVQHGNKLWLVGPPPQH